MTSLIFLLLAGAMVGAARGWRRGGMALFGVAAVLGVVWFNHHMTDPLKLGF